MVVQTDSERVRLSRRLVLELLLSLNRKEGTTLVLVTHDEALSSRASRRITLRDGRIVSDERENAERATEPRP